MKKNQLKLIQNLALTGTANTLMTYSEYVSAAPSTENTPAPMDVDEDKASDDKKVTENQEDCKRSPLLYGFLSIVV
mgnify:CR=1 FL=1